MASADRLLALLPSLWRPEPDAPGPEQAGGDLLAGLIRSAGAGFDRLAVEAGEVMQAHWFAPADSALTAPWVARWRALAGEAPLLPRDPAVDAHPHLHDLPRIAALLGLSPWAEPLDQRERVEDFRRRVRRIVAIHREGVGTKRALLAMARASLPLADPQAPPGLRERGVTVEEAAPVHRRAEAAITRGVPDGMVGPLMRWQAANPARQASRPVLYVTGVEAKPGLIDPTTDPVIERVEPATGRGVGIAYRGTVAPGETLAIEPVTTAWVGGDASLASATAGPGEDPTAPGPFAAVAGGPAGRVVAMATGADGGLWAAANDGGIGALWRLGEGGWAERVGGLPALGALAADGDVLLLGHAGGVSRLAVFDDPPSLVPPPAGGTGPAVTGLARARDGRWWAATAAGAAVLGAGDALTMIGPGDRAATETPLAAVWADSDGTLFFGGEAGLFAHNPASGAWHVYRGGTADELVPDWAGWDPTGPLPDTAEGFLPAVTAIRRVGAGGGLWLGTARGLAHWAARPRRGTYGTTLHALPALGPGPVHALAEDARGRLWAATDRGVVLWDGLDWWQIAAGGPVRLPRDAGDALAFTHWRFDRAADAWQVQRRDGNGGFATDDSPAVTTAEPAAHALAWTDGARARLGTLGPGGFTPTGPAPGALALRLKPDPTRIVTGGIAAVPAMPPGDSHWRYLALEEAPPPTPGDRPAWTREGRLLVPPPTPGTPVEGRFLALGQSVDDHSVFAFNPAAKVTLAWAPRTAFSVLVRLEKRAEGEALPALVLDRLATALARVRPAGVRVAIAHGETIVRGGPDG